MNLQLYPMAYRLGQRANLGLLVPGLNPNFSTCVLCLTLIVSSLSPKGLVPKTLRSFRDFGLIGEDRCFVIAEGGINHNGSLDLAKQLVDVACDAGGSRACGGHKWKWTPSDGRLWRRWRRGIAMRRFRCNTPRVRATCNRFSTCTVLYLFHCFQN